MYSRKLDFDSDEEEVASRSDDSDPDYSIYNYTKKKPKTPRNSKFSLKNLRKQLSDTSILKLGSSPRSRIRGGAMTSAQASFSAGGGDGGGGAGGGGATTLSQLQTVTVQAPQQQQLVSVIPQNGVIKVSLSPEPGDQAQVTAQVVVSSGPSSENSTEQQLVSGQQYIAVTESAGSRSYTSLTPVNPTVVTDGGDAVVSDAVTGTTYVHYVEATGDQGMYQTANGQQMAGYPVFAVGTEAGAMYTPASVAPQGQYYSASGATGAVYSQVAGGTTYHIIQESEPMLTEQRDSPTSTVNADNGGGVTYLVSGGSGAGGAMNDDAHSGLSHATRISPATHKFGQSVGKRRSQFQTLFRNPSYIGMVQWLLENYETAEGVSLPRSTLYNHYLRHCNDHKLDPVNAASFGKLIRSVFLGLRTRRLGTRGNSKYHYYGIRIKPSSALNQMLGGGGSDEGGPRAQSGGAKRFKFSSASGKGGGDNYDQGTNQSNHSCSQSPQGHEYEEIQVLSSNFNSQRQAQTPGQQQHLQYLGDSSAAVPDFPEIEVSDCSALPGDCTLEDVDTLRSIYREHCEAFLDAVVNLEFATVESLWREFWRHDNNNGEECEEEKYLSKTKLFQLCKCESVQRFVRRVDFLFYQNLVDVLIPDVLRPIPSSLTQAIRNFAKGLESWLTGAMVGCPEAMVALKVSAVGALAQTLRRYTSLNHLAQAARAVLQNSQQINQMLVDLNRVDFHNVQEQASWVCQCDDQVVQRLENDFKATLQRQNSLEQWAVWLKGVVQQVLKPYEGKPNYARAARQFLLKWSFYSSMVIRDLTLRSAASFGSFHLIRLLYDEYMFYLIEHQVALETGETPIAVMGEKYSCGGSELSDDLCLGYAGQQCNGAKMSPLSEENLTPAKRHKIS